VPTVGETTKKYEMYIGHMCRWLTDNKKISHKEESAFTLRCIGSLLCLFKGNIMGKYYSMNEAASISIRCTADYKKSLKNKNYIFIYQDRAKNHKRAFDSLY